MGHKMENSYYLALYRKSMHRFYSSTPSGQVNPGTAQDDRGRSLLQPAAI